MTKVTSKLTDNANDAKMINASSDYRIVTDLSRLLGSRHWALGLKLFSRQAARSMLLGNVRSRFRGRGMEFEEVRRYQAGDDIRTIDWKVSARVGRPYTKLFCEERERPCHIMVDQRSHLFFGSTIQCKSVLAAELGAALGWAALAGGDQVGGQVMGDHTERDSRARRNKQAVLRLIHDLHELNHELQNQVMSPHEQTVSLSRSLEECRRITRPGTAIFIISDFHDFDQAAAKALSSLGKHTDVTLIHVIDSLEEKLPVTGNVAISDGEHQSNVTISPSLREAYQASLRKRQAVLESAVIQARALYAKVSTAQTARQALTKIFAA